MTQDAPPCDVHLEEKEISEMVSTVLQDSKRNNPPGINENVEDISNEYIDLLRWDNTKAPFPHTKEREQFLKNRMNHLRPLYARRHRNARRDADGKASQSNALSIDTNDNNLENGISIDNPSIGNVDVWMMLRT